MVGRIYDQCGKLDAVFFAKAKVLLPSKPVSFLYKLMFKKKTLACVEWKTTIIGELIVSHSKVKFFSGVFSLSFVDRNVFFCGCRLILGYSVC